MFRVVRSLLAVSIMLSVAASAEAAVPWALAWWQHRMPVQMHNRAAYAQAKAVVLLKDFPFLLLTSEDKLALPSTDVVLIRR